MHVCAALHVNKGSLGSATVYEDNSMQTAA